MTKYHTIKNIKIHLAAIVAVCISLIPSGARAFDLSTYAEASRLADGRWVKISIKSDGIYMLSNAQLRKMGFTDPSKVHVYGYGGRQLSDYMTRSSYIDDLPVVPVLRTDKGILFYGEGVTEAVTHTGNYVRPRQNAFTDEGYYFLSDRDGEDKDIPTIGTPSASSPETTFLDYIFHEKDLVSISPTGQQYGGEDFLYTPSRSFNFQLTDREEESKVWLLCSFLTTAKDETSISLSVNDKALPSSSSDKIRATSNDHGNYRAGVTTKTFFPDNDKISVGVTFNRNGTVSAAHLDYLAINYTRKLRLSDSQLRFSISRNQASLEGAGASTLVWDITSPLDIKKMETGLSGSALKWTNEYTGTRRYIAFDPTASFPEPTYVGVVANQNLHGIEVPDMVIFTPSVWQSEAQRLADFHKSQDGLSVTVVNQDDVFNEFASGSRDVNAFRKMLKMLYDRSANSEKQLKYALFMGRGSYDNRRISTSVKALSYPLMPLWQSEQGETDLDSYTTDDILAFLNDNSGANMPSDYLCIGVGRMPVTSLSGAKSAVDKIITYSTKSATGTWRNRTLLIADDQDKGVHMTQMEQVWNKMLENGGDNAIHTKLYTDAYQLTGQGYPQARDFMFKTLDEGVAWWMFIGHANTTSLTHEGLLKLSDINDMYLRKWPILIAATCDFLRWDGNSISAGEVMWSHESGGCIAQISANRPVYISENVYFSRALAQHMFTRDDAGNRLTLGEIYRRAKNSSRVSETGVMLNDANKMRYILMGDPAMRPVMPQQQIIVDLINGVEPGGDEHAVMQARQDVMVEGRVLDSDGNIINGFNGTIASTLYDAEYSITTLGNGGEEEGKKVTFEQHGDRIFAGNDSIRDGRFRVRIAMPSSISNNYREASLSLVARNEGAKDLNGYAAGVNRDFFVYGTDENVVDTIPPVIK
ncbi:MAG: type IX secretion system sortase PorU, partial [Muribaculaceae bacterium]|nr:type IX secretion system sortase PorU [Muribaculaceae bacterium]